MTARVQTLAEGFIGSGPRTSEIEALARVAAEAQYALEQIRIYRASVFQLHRRKESDIVDLAQMIEELRRLDRYGQRAVSRRRRAIRDLDLARDSADST